ncbi:MAG TPA: hypothetical protein P5050_08795 [Bacteroidia bacterium]|nr:hypothetical protein [Bacteroidia bacterium]HRS59303.1 hypothetical protein [Bacteroidia bacterium]HRU68243.1 hypothetical protein [Bacteroidia bacterium]
MEQDIKELYFDQRLWINRIRFYKEQLVILQNNLDKMVKYYSHPELMAEVEQYQNKIIVYQDLADRLIKEYKELRNQVQEFDGNEISSFNRQHIDAINKEINTKAKNFISFFEMMKDDFLEFYTSHHLSENHVINN